jgi:hypothetical protein
MIVDDFAHAFVNYKDVVYWKYVDNVIYVTFDYHDGEQYKHEDMAYVQLQLRTISENKYFLHRLYKKSNHDYVSAILVDDELRAHPDRFNRKDFDIDEVHKLISFNEPKWSDEVFAAPRDDTWRSFVYDDAYFAMMYA